MSEIVLKEFSGDDVELRCPGTLQAILKTSEDLIEIKCHHIRCTKGKGVDVFHYYSPVTGELVDTRQYKAIARRQKNGRSS